jgi:hypothetical protein
MHPYAASTTSTHPDPESYKLLFPMTPLWTERYERKREVPASDPKFTVNAMQTKFESPAIDGWTEYCHPEGLPYYFHRSNKIVTDANLRNPVELKKVSEFFKVIRVLAWQESREIPVNSLLVLELMKDGDADKISCGYYFVDEEHRSLFWLRDFEADYLLRDVKGHVSEAHFSENDLAS